MRAVAKETTLGKRKVWGVYDAERASWPAQVPEFGKVKQDLPTEEEAQAEADRLNKFFA